ncbi:MAG: hypothetical protein AB2693_27875, partial [Candidatus Thiodiazotropha sp.]
MLSDAALVQDGGDSEAFDTGVEDSYTLVRNKRQRISTGGQSNEPCTYEEPPNYETLSNEEKLSLLLSKVTLNEARVVTIQNKLDTVIDLSKRVSSVERVLKSHDDRLTLLEYRSLDIEARSRRKNILFKGLPEDRRENCFEIVRDFIRHKLDIDRDMYLERAHRLGRYDQGKIRPIIVAFRDFCDVEDIIGNAKKLKDSNFGVSRDYPLEIAKARQSLWKQFKEIRDNNPDKKVTLGFPAKIIVGNEVVVDLFPNWFGVLGGSRIDFTNVQKPWTITTDTAEQNITARGLATDTQMSDQTQSQENIPIVPPSPDISYAMDFEVDKSSPSPVDQQKFISTFSVPPANIQMQTQSTPDDLDNKSVESDPDSQGVRGRSRVRKPNVNKSQKSRSQSLKPVSRKASTSKGSK